MNRRTFVKTTAAAGAGLGLAPYIARGGVSANDKIVVGFIGVNSRGNAVAQAFARQPGAEVGFICDVDDRALARCIRDVAAIQGKQPEGLTDLRRLLERSDVDAVGIAMPDHWHAPAALLAMQAGKHVYLEKPGSHNPRESEMLVEAQRKYNRVVQLGTQQRSAPASIQAMAEIAEGLIGRPYYGKAWYASARGSIGFGKEAPVPDWLHYDLWQGPAPRTPYRDNVIHYNWHWFRHWGTGEVCNNGTHELDVCRWALGVEYPLRVTSSGGRYHFNDDWEFFDTQLVTFDFEDDKTIVWEGRSCNPLPHYGRGRGASIHGTEGTIVIDRQGYIVYDLDNKEVKRVEEGDADAGLNTVGAGDLTDRHVANFLSAIARGTDLHQPIDSGQRSVLMCHLGNIAQYTGRTLYIDQRNGHIVGDPQAMAFWSRTYEPGWEPSV
ncbi:MAG: gfo/Idh/MocA family oxidoreductase [Bacteroidetes bacterium]|nr:MAG: gfo/Idh/MocA family oxidoreductase [Bacteroidota bacterium]